MPLRVATFNAGLAIGVLPNSTARVAPIVSALVELAPDLLFVQEFWLDADFERLRTALEPQLPHALRAPPTRAPVPGGCDDDALEPLRECAKRNCAGLRDEALAQCVISRCAQDALSLRPECLNCLATHPLGTFDEIVARCLSRTTATRSMLPASSAGVASDSGPRSARGQKGVPSSAFGGLIAYGGSYGTALLSRAPFEEHDFLDYESSVNARGAIHARVSVRELGPVHVFATHFSPGGSEQTPQVERLVRWVDEKAGSAPAILFGDLNMTSSSALFRQLTDAGFREADELDRRGTFHSGGLTHGTTSDSGIRIDHILTRGATLRATVQRILDRPMTLDVGGRPTRTTLSDHFGLLGTLSTPE